MYKILVGFLMAVFTTIFAWADPATFSAKFKEDVKIAKTKLEVVAPEKIKAMIKTDEDFIILDVRDSDELVIFGRPDWKNYKNISRGRLELLLGGSGLKEDDKILVICKTSTRSALAGATLKEYGFKNIMVLNGGMDAWALYNLPEIEGSAQQY